jgi:hypothetical protein
MYKLTGAKLLFRINMQSTVVVVLFPLQAFFWHHDLCNILCHTNLAFDQPLQVLHLR